MPKFTVTVEVRQLIELEVEAPSANDLYCHFLHKDLSPETQNKLNNPHQYGTITQTDIEVEEVVIHPINLGEQDHEFEEGFNNNQILELQTDGEKLIILFSDGSQKLIFDDQEIYQILSVFNQETLNKQVQKLYDQVSF